MTALAAIGLLVLAAGIWAVARSVRGASRTCNAILDDLHQPRKEKP